MIKPKRKKKARTSSTAGCVSSSADNAGSHDIRFIPPFFPSFQFNRTLFYWLQPRENVQRRGFLVVPRLSSRESSRLGNISAGCRLISSPTRVLPRGISHGEAQVIWKRLGSAPRGRRRRSLVLPGVSGDGCELLACTVQAEGRACLRSDAPGLRVRQ